MGNKKAINRKDSKVRSNSNEAILVGSQRAVLSHEVESAKVKREIKKYLKEESWKAKEQEKCKK